MKTLTVLTPYRNSAAIDLGNSRWKKQLLPVGDIDYKGRKLSFTKDYLTELAKSFKDKAFDRIPFQLAGADNKHTNDPERTRGFIEDVEVDADGLYVVVDLTEAGEKVLKDNPSLGVSARIYENYERSDGKRWSAALQHVLGCLDPHIAGMKPWKEVAALSNQQKTRVLDLTSAHFDEEGGEPVALTDSDKTALRDLLKKVRDGGDAISDEDIEGLIGDAEGTEEGTSDEELTDEELEAIIAEAEAEDTEPIAASNGHVNGDTLELTQLRAQSAEQAIELARVSAQLADSAFQNEKAVFVNQFGFAPSDIELARPLLEGEGHVIQLSGGDEIDAGQVMRRVLTEIGKKVKMLDLSGLLGNGMPPTDEEVEQANKEEADRRAFVEGEKQRLGLV